MSYGNSIIYRGGDPQSYPELVELTTAQGLQATAEKWHREMMPGHFTSAGGQKYRYTPRKGDNEPPRLPFTKHDGTTTYRANPHYSWRKRREKHHNRPLVWTGESEESARAQVKLSVVKRAGGTIEARASMTLSNYFYKYRLDVGNRIDKANELTRTTADEQIVLRDFLDEFIYYRTNQHVTQRIVTK